jgi:hypothetical protein
VDTKSLHHHPQTAVMLVAFPVVDHNAEKETSLMEMKKSEAEEVVAVEIWIHSVGRWWIHTMGVSTVLLWLVLLLTLLLLLSNRQC